jgi:hypothetical protein
MGRITGYLWNIKIIFHVYIISQHNWLICCKVICGKYKYMPTKRRDKQIQAKYQNVLSDLRKYEYRLTFSRIKMAVTLPITGDASVTRLKTESSWLPVSVSSCSGTSNDCPGVGSGRDRFTTGAIALEK